MQLFELALYTAILVQSGCAVPTSSVSSRSTPESTIQPLYTFPNGTTGELLWVRDDGSVLFNLLTPYAATYYFPSDDYTSPVLLYSYTGSAAAYGITEYAPDVYAVLVGTFNRSGTPTTTGEVWSLDLTRFELGEDGTVTSPAQASILSSISDVGFFNGAATLTSGRVLAADSSKGVVYAIDTQTGSYSVVLNDTTMAPNPSGTVRLGVNGLAVINETLYFTNTNKRTVNQVQLNADGTAAGPYAVVATNILVDDIDVDPCTGGIYIPSLVGNAISYVSPNGTVSVLAGSLNSTDVPGPTAVKLAEEKDCQAQRGYTRLLISTSGGIEYPINGTYVMGGGLYELIVDQSVLV